MKEFKEDAITLKNKPPFSTAVDRLENDAYGSEIEKASGAIEANNNELLMDADNVSPEIEKAINENVRQQQIINDTRKINEVQMMQQLNDPLPYQPTT